MIILPLKPLFFNPYLSKKFLIRRPLVWRHNQHGNNHFQFVAQHFSYSLTEIQFLGMSQHCKIRYVVGRISTVEAKLNFWFEVLPKNQLGWNPNLGKSLRNSLLSSNDELSGEIHSKFESLTMLNEFNLRNNKLIGKIPNEIGWLLVLNYLDVSSNYVFGNIPLEL